MVIIADLEWKVNICSTFVWEIMCGDRFCRVNWGKVEDLNWKGVGPESKFTQRMHEAGSSNALGAGDEGFVNKSASRRGKEKLISRK